MIRDATTQKKNNEKETQLVQILDLTKNTLK